MSTDPHGSLRLVARHGALYALATAAQAVAGVLVLPLATRIMDPGEFGIVATVAVVTQVLVPVLTFGLIAPIARAYYEARDDGESADPHRLLGAAVIAALLGGAILLATLPLWSRLFSSVPAGSPLALGTATAAGVAIVLAGQALLRAQRKVATFVLSAVISTLGGQSIGLILTLALRPTASTYLLGPLIGAGLAAGIVLISLRPRLKIRTSTWSHGMREGLPTLPHLLAILLLAGVDRVLVERILGLTSVGRYHVAYQLGAVGVAFVIAITNAWMPHVDATAEADRPVVLARTASIMDELAGGVAVITALGAPLGLAVLMPVQLDPRSLTPVVVIVAAAPLIYLRYLANAAMLFREGRNAVFSWAAPVAVIVNVAANLIAIPRWNLEGAAAATIASYIVLAAAVSSRRRRVVAVRWRGRTRLAALLAYGAAAIASLALSPNEDADPIRLVMCLGVAGVVAARMRMRLAEESGTPAGMGGAAV